MAPQAKPASGPRREDGLAQRAQWRHVLSRPRPQVASQAHQHYRVTKVKSSNATRTGIEVLNAAQRIDEIARMIGGLEITPATLALAAEMLETAQ